MSEAERSLVESLLLQDGKTDSKSISIW